MSERGVRMIELAQRLYPICRSITGDGVRQTLRIVDEQLPLTMHEVATGTPAFDWFVPPEWNLRRATLRGPNGDWVADTNVHNLHVLNYSTPFHDSVSLEELRPHLFSSPQRPDDIPYRTSYYKPQWGLCLPHRVVEQLPAGTYEVDVDTTLAPGALTYGEALISGETSDEFVFSAHVCHPSLANDNLSGIAVAIEVAKALQAMPRRRLSYRFIFAPGTIGAIVWLSRNQDRVERIRHGLILSCLGDAGQMTYKQSRRGHAEIDVAMSDVLREKSKPFEVRPFSPYGYDERQYCSPGFDLPFGVLMRTPYGEFPQYHTSADNCSLLDAAALDDSVRTVLAAIDKIEQSRESVASHRSAPTLTLPRSSGRGDQKRFRNLLPLCEPQLGKRGLYATTGGTTKSAGYEMALLWVLNLSDGDNDLAAIAARAKLSVDVVAEAADALLKAELLEPITP